MCDISEVKPTTFRSTADDPTCIFRHSNHTEVGNVSYISLCFKDMLTGKKYHCSVGCKVFCGIFNILREGVARDGRRGVACCVMCGCDIESGEGGREWEEVEEDEEVKRASRID